MDDDTATMWHTNSDADATKLPHWLELEFSAPENFAGCAVLPRQDGNRNGWIKDFKVP